MALAVLARAFYGQGTDRGLVARLLASLFPPAGAPAPAPDPAATPITIAAPLTADHWRDVLELRGRADLFAALIANRSALIVSAAILAADPSLRDWLGRDRGLLRWLVRTAPGSFSAAARGLRIDGDRVAMPGGAAAVPMWEAVVAEKVTRPAEFIRALVTRDSGRLAWLYGAAAHMSPDRLAAMTGPGPVAAQIDQVRTMADAFRSGDQNWKIEEHPFLRSVADSWMVATQVEIAGGQVAGPNWQWLWKAVFDRDGLSRREAASMRREAEAGGPEAAAPITLPWLTAQIASTPPRERRERFESVRFAQAVFGATGEAEATDMLIALSGFRRYHALIVTLDRLGIRAPRTYARAVEAAQRLDGRPGRERRVNLVALQGALAIVERAGVSHAISPAAAEQLVLSLADAVDRDAPFMPAVARWLTTTLAAALPALVQPDRWTVKTAYESQFLQAMAGPVAAGNTPVIEWGRAEIPRRPGRGRAPAHPGRPRATRVARPRCRPRVGTTRAGGRRPDGDRLRAGTGRSQRPGHVGRRPHQPPRLRAQRPGRVAPSRHGMGTAARPCRRRPGLARAGGLARPRPEPGAAGAAPAGR